MATNITGFLGYSFVNSGSIVGLQLGATGPTNWPADGTTTTANTSFTGLSNGTGPRYVQFTVSPGSDSLTINSISLQACQNATAATMNVAVGYSTDGIHFTTFNSNGLSGNSLSGTAGIWSTFSASPTLTLGNNGTVIVRVIIWRKASSSASSTAVFVGNVMVSGYTTKAAIPSITLSTFGPLNFGITPVGNSSAPQNFNMNGLNLTNNIIVTPPPGFEIRTGTNAFSSNAITLVRSGSSVFSTQIDVRFTPLSTGSYSGNIQCSSIGAIEQGVAVNGGTLLNYYSKSSGTLDALSTWTTNSNGGAGSAPSNFTTPGQNFYIRNNSAPTLGTNWIVSGSNSKVIIGDGINSCVFTIPSSYTYSGQATEISNHGTLVLQNASSFSTLGTFSVDSGGVYQHDCNGGAQLTGTFMTGSTINVTGVSTSNMYLPQLCYNVIWNCPSQTAAGKFYNLDGTLSINGNLTILSSGSGYCGVNTGSGIRTLNIGGILDIQGGSFRLLGASSGSGLTTVNVAGNVTISGSGTLNLSSTSYATPTSPILNVHGNFLHTAGTVTKTSSTSSASITFNGTIQQQFSTTGINAAIDYVINNSSTGITLGSAVVLNGTLTLDSGNINTSALNLLTLGPSTTVTDGSAISFINGPLARTVATTVPTVNKYPIGKGTSYRPLQLSVTQNAATSTVYSAEQFNFAPSAYTLPGSLVNVSPIRYFNITKGSGAGITSASVRLSYDADDLISDATDLRIAKDNGAGAWIDLGGAGTAPIAGTITSSTNFTTFGDFDLANTERILSLRGLIEGFYDSDTMIPDTVTVELHNAISPYTLIESQKGLLSNNGVGSFGFSSALNGTPYYLILKHRNAIETWSSFGNSFISSALSYDFTQSQSKAYGNNLVQKGSKWCLYNGDVNQDGIIDSGDLGVVDNDNTNYVAGYISTDVNGDGIVDSGDLGIVDNNNAAYVGRIIPAIIPIAKSIRPPLNKRNKTVQ